MNNLILRTLAGMSLLAVSTASMAATINITASFSPSIDKPENNTFTNTTPQSGYCSNWPQFCPGFVSIELPIIVQSTKTILPSSERRDGMFIKTPSAIRRVTVRNDATGEISILNFRVNLFSAKYAPNTGGNNTWGNNGTMAYPDNSGSNGCSSVSGGGSFVSSGEEWAKFGWFTGTNASAGCSRQSAIVRNSIELTNISFGYLLQAPNPLLLSDGVYTGELNLSIGPGGDFDFGDNLQASDSELKIIFSLTVYHELKLTTTAENQAVSLQPCASNRVCTADEGQANWERWMVTRIPPQLTGRSNFNLSSSGEFTVYLECEQQSGPDCALRSDKMPSQTVPVRTLLTLPDNIVDSVTGSPVSKRPLAAGRDLTKNVFVTKTFGQNKAGSIDFQVSQKDVDTMLTTRPDTYRGAVTVIFDPKIH